MSEPNSCGNCGEDTENEPLTLCDECQASGSENESLRARIERLEGALRTLIVDAKRIADVYPNDYRGTVYDDLEMSLRLARAALKEKP